MSGFVPMSIAKPKIKYDAVLVDDGNLVHLTWQMDAKSQNKNFKAYLTIDGFMKDVENINLQTPLFVDSNLGNGIKGEEVSRKLYEIGFKNIYLCTGYEASAFESMTWITEVVGKEPRWT